MGEEEISWEQFSQVELRVGTIITVSKNEKARKPAYVLRIDFGEEQGVKQSSAQLTQRYSPKDLEGKQVLCVCNFPPKRIAGVLSEVLVTGVISSDDEVVLVSPDISVEDGSRLC